MLLAVYVTRTSISMIFGSLSRAECKIYRCGGGTCHVTFVRRRILFQPPLSLHIEYGIPYSMIVAWLKHAQQLAVLGETQFEPIPKNA